MIFSCRSLRCNCSHACVHAQVVQELPLDLAMAVVQRMPASLEHKLTNLPRCLTSIVALSCCADLAANFHPASDSSAPRSVDDVSSTTSIALCVDTRAGDQEDPDADEEAGNEDASGAPSYADIDEIAGASMWLTSRDADRQSVDNGLCSLRRRSGTVVCMLSTTRAVQNITISLAPNQCIVLGPVEYTLTKVTIKGAHTTLTLMLASQILRHLVVVERQGNCNEDANAD